MSEKDPMNEAFVRLVEVEFKRAAEAKDDYTLPWLDLDVEAYRAFREGQTSVLPPPYGGDPALARMLANAQGLDVLCLAGGAGQQSAVYGLLGANVTVFDLTPSQLEGDQVAARHYGYPVKTIQGDMHDLSGITDASFDRIHQPISTLYCYDLERLYAGVARILKPGGFYYVDFAFPLLYMVDKGDWDGQGYPVQVFEPYQRGEIRELPGGRGSYTQGEPIGEYHHLLSDMINGLIAAGLNIAGLWENPRPDDGIGAADLPPGSKEHRERYLPFGISIFAEKTSMH
jgi:ubiquinone/menaquinone biosynthesis C-methylase UbiE